MYRCKWLRLTYGERSITGSVKPYPSTTYLYEPEGEHEGKVAHPVEGEGKAHGGGARLLPENLPAHDERDRPWNTCT